MDELTVKSSDPPVKTVTEARDAPRNRVEDRLNIRRRLADHPQDFRRRRLLFQRLAYLRMSLRERLILLLQFREQPNILDGNDCLVRERSYQFHLLVSERLHVRATNRDDSDDSPIAKHRDL